jgi:membrane-associated phospholipid phosphatase
LNPDRPSAQVTRFLAVAVVLLGGAHLLDPVAQVYLVLPGIYEEDWGRLLRVMGFYPLWLLMGLAILLVAWKRRPGEWRPPAVPARRAGLLVLTPAVGGLVAEIAKISFRRLRPTDIPGEYLFRAWTERPLYSGGLGLPSSHALVAFAAAAILARIYPRAAPIWYLLAIGCGLSRVAAGAHFLSDIAMAGVLGWLTARFMWRWNFGKGPEPLEAPVRAAPTPAPRRSEPAAVTAS